MVNISDRVSTFETTYAVAEANPDIWATVGTHPHEAKENPHLTARDIIDLAARPKVVGIGETGLDFHYDLSPREVQAAVFRQHVIAARETSPPARPACRWSCTRARRMMSWRGFSRRNTPPARSAC